MRSADRLAWLRRRAGWLVWGALALIILSGLDQIWADPDRVRPGMTAPIVLSEFSATGDGLSGAQLAAMGYAPGDAPDLVSSSYDVFMVDYRGYGQSTGQITDEL